MKEFLFKVFKDLFQQETVILSSLKNLILYRMVLWCGLI